MSAVLAFVAVPSASGEEIDGYTAAGTPSYVKPSATTTFTISLTNKAASSREADAAKIGIPAGFVVDAASLKATASAADDCVASTWIADGTLIADGKINVKRPGGGSNNRLCPGATLTVVFSATSSVEGAYMWATELRRGEDTFVLTGAQPSVVVDGTPPVVTISSQPPNPSNDPSPTFAFSTNEPATLACNLDGGEFTGCASPKDYASLADGSHTFTVNATDPAGNTGTASYTWLIETTLPIVTLTEKPSATSKTSTAAFSFTASKPATFECKLDGGSYADCASPATYADLAEGPHTFAVRATDAAANTGPETTYTWTVDTIAPNTAITAHPPSLSNQRSATFAFSTTEAASFECKLDGGVFATCASPKSYSGLGDGLHSFSVRATDAAGNTGEVTYSWTVDATPPQVTINGAPNNPTNSQSASFSFTASDPTECKLDGGDFAACSGSAGYAGLAEGVHTFVVKANDAAGNVSQATYTWTVDITPPTVEIIGDKPGNPTNSKTATFTFTATASPMQCRLDNAAFAACTSPRSYSNLLDGSHTFTVRATDAAGNTAEASHTWTIDSAAPTVTITQMPPNATKNRSATFAFTTSEPAQCQLDSAAFAACTSPVAYTDLPDGVHTFVVKATDAAGNTGQDIFQWRIDNVAPAVVITQKPNDPSDVKSPTFAFTVNEAGAVQCKLDAESFAACSSPKGYTNLADGSHVFTVQATDGAGNTGQAQYSWRVETRFPIVTLIDRPRNPSTTTSADFEFSTRAGATLECSLDGAAYVACTSPKVYGGLAQGEHTFGVRAKDAAGTGPATTYTWLIDSVGPSVALTQTPSGLTSSRSATFTFSASEPGALACELDGGGFGPCASPVSYEGLADGSHTFTVRPTDLLGNVGASASYTWRVDGTAPETTLVSAPSARTTSVSATFAFSANEPAAFQCKLDGGSFEPCASPKALTGLTRAGHTFEVRAVDAAGNVDSTPAVHRWTITGAPTTTRTARASSALLAPRAGARVTSPPLLRWRRVARASYYNVQLFRRGVKILSAWPTTTRLQLRARWKYLGRQRRLSPGTYRWYVWPGYGKPSLRRYGRLLGASTFTVRR